MSLRRARGLLAVIAALLAPACATRRVPDAAAVPPPAAAAGESALGQIVAREDRRIATDGVLASFVAGPDAALRARACRALGRIGDPASIELLARALADPVVEVRREAAFGLGEVALPAIVPTLEPALADVDAEVRFLAHEALTKAPTPEGSARSRELLAKEADPVAAAAMRYSFRFKDPAWLPLLLDRAREGGALLGAAIYALGRTDLKAIEAASPISEATKRGYVAAMEAAARDADPFVASVAARGLGRFPELSIPSRDEAIRVALGRPEIAVRIEALRAYAERFKKSGLVWHEVRDLADDGRATVRQTALETLGAAGGPEAESLLRARLRTGGTFERAAALTALFAMGPESMDRELAPMLAGEWPVRAALAEGLGGEGVAYGAEALDKLLADADARVKVAAITSAVARKLPAADDALRTGLEHDDYVIRATAADEIAKRDDARAFAPELRAAFARPRDDRTNDARLSLLDAFAKAEMTVELAAALTDADGQVRRKASELLEKATGKPAPVEPAAIQAPARPYDEILRAPRPALVTVTTARGAFDVELLWDEAPLTCRNFVSLVQRGHFDGLVFHRIVPDFVVQDGCPRGDGWGGPGYQIRCEINRTRFGKGAVGMALSGKDTGGSQYFVTLTPTPHLDGGYTVFGRVTSGMEVVESLALGDATVRMVAR